MKIKSVIQIVRHGARTSSLIGRLEDLMLSTSRKGLTCVGFSQLFRYGHECKKNPLFMQFYQKGCVHLHVSNKERSVESAQGFIDGLLSQNSESEIIHKEEDKFSMSVYPVGKFDKNTKYDTILKQFHRFHLRLNYFKNKPLKTSFPELKSIQVNSNKFIFAKEELSANRQIPIRVSNSIGYSLISQMYPYLKQLFLKDLSESVGVYNFEDKCFLDSSFFEVNSSSIRRIKLLTDFITCNKYYEDIPLYKSEYSQLTRYLRNFLCKYSSLNLGQRDYYYMRLRHFLMELDNLMKSEVGSFNIFINHSGAMRSLLRLVLSDSAYQDLSDRAKESDACYYLLFPKFCGEIALYLYENCHIEILINRQNITHLIRQEFRDEINGLCFLNYHKFRNYINALYD